MMRTNPDVHNEFDPSQEVIHPSHALYEELKKNPRQMDVHTIEREIVAFHPDHPRQECEQMLRRIRKSESRVLRRRPIRRVVAACACALVFIMLTASAANAFSFKSILEFFSNFPELFAFKSDSIDPPSIQKESADIEGEGAWVREDDNALVTYSDPEAFMDSLPGYQEGIRSLLSHYAFTSAEKNSDEDFESWSLFMVDEESACPFYVRIIVQKYVDTSIGYFYKRDPDDIDAIWFNDIQIAYAQNEGTCSARWSQQAFHGSVWGKLSLDAILNIAKEIIGGTKP